MSAACCCGGDAIQSPRVGFLSIRPDFSGQQSGVENVTLTRNTLKVCLFYYCLPMQKRTRATERQESRWIVQWLRAENHQLSPNHFHNYIGVYSGTELTHRYNLCQCSSPQSLENRFLSALLTRVE